MATRLYECPECGNDTVVEHEMICGIKSEIERCDGLIEVQTDKPLQACTWQQELRILSNGIFDEVA